MQRFIDIPNVFNFRDIGGYPTKDGRSTRWGTLYRSGELHRLDAIGVDRLRTAIGLRTEVDLRWADDLERAGTLGPLVESGIDRRHIPLGSAEILKDIPPLPIELAYLPIAARSGPAVVSVARTIGDESSHPIVIHCSAGKDRTGVFIALLLALLGVDDELIVDDYALTASEMTRWINYRIERGELPRERITEPHPGDAIAPDAIQSMLDTLRNEHESIEGYFLHHGLTGDEVELLRSSLLE